MFLYAFFFANFGIFSSTPTPLPPKTPHPTPFGIRSGVKGERSFPPESRGWG